MDSWNWGDVPTWIGSIITSVSLLLAFIILRNDQRTRTRALADGFVVWPEFVHDRADDRWLLRVNWHNTGNAPILRPHVMERVDGRLVPRGFLGTQELIIATVDPGESGGKPMHHLSGAPKDVYLSFTDGRGREWWRDLSSTGRYFSVRKMKRWIKRHQRLSKGKPGFMMPGITPQEKQAASTAKPASPTL